MAIVVKLDDLLHDRRMTLTELAERIDITLANADVIVPDDKGLASTLRGSFATTVTGLLWSLQLIIVGLCFVGPWALIIWLLVRWYRRSSAKA